MPLVPVNEVERAPAAALSDDEIAFFAAVHDGRACPFCGASTTNVYPFCFHEAGCRASGFAPKETP